MPAELPVVLAMSGEDGAHVRAVRCLTDRVLSDAIPWVAESLEHIRVWLAAENHPLFPLSDAFELARTRKLPIHGHFGGAVGLREAKLFRAALLLWDDEVSRGQKIDALVLARDLDGAGEKLGGMLQAVGGADWPFSVVVAWFQPEAEAWYLCGFEPEDDRDRARLKAETARLGFSPVTEAHRLTSTARDSPRDAKKVLQSLVDGSSERRGRCLEIPLDRLRERGEAVGLTAFLAQVKEKLVPLLEGPG